MFRTIGHTFSLMKMSWRVLMQDRELILFPIMAGIGVAILVGVLAAVAAATELGNKSVCPGPTINRRSPSPPQRTTPHP